MKVSSMDDRQIQGNRGTFARRILKSQVFYCLVVGLFWLLFLIIDFCGGYRGFHLSIVLFPATFVAMLFALIFTLVVLIRAIWSIIRLRHVIRSILFILLTLAFWFIPTLFSVFLQRPYMLGFKYRVLRLSTPQELREIAAKARMLLTEQHYLPGPGKHSLWEEEVHAELWGKMPKSKILSSCNSIVVISVSDSNCVTLSWGGAMVGHWGVRIADHPLERDKHDFEFIPIEQDIAVYMSTQNKRVL